LKIEIVHAGIVTITVFGLANGDQSLAELGGGN
jgi:hypothetical protein